MIKKRTQHGSNNTNRRNINKCKEKKKNENYRKNNTEIQQKGELYKKTTIKTRNKNENKRNARGVGRRRHHSKQRDGAHRHPKTEEECTTTHTIPNPNKPKHHIAAHTCRQIHFTRHFSHLVCTFNYMHITVHGSRRATQRVCVRRFIPSSCHP